MAFFASLPAILKWDRVLINIQARAHWLRSSSYGPAFWTSEPETHRWVVCHLRVGIFLQLTRYEWAFSRCFYLCGCRPLGRQSLGSLLLGVDYNRWRNFTVVGPSKGVAAPHVCWRQSPYARTHSGLCVLFYDVCNTFFPWLVCLNPIRIFGIYIANLIRWMINTVRPILRSCILDWKFAFQVTLDELLTAFSFVVSGIFANRLLISVREAHYKKQLEAEASYVASLRFARPYTSPYTSTRVTVDVETFNETAGV